MRIAMTSIGHSMDLPSISLIRTPSDSHCNASGFGLMRTPQEGRFSGYERPNELFYEPYAASDYASSSTSTYGSDWHQQQSGSSPSSRCSPWSTNSTPYVHYAGPILHSQLLDDDHVERNAPLPPFPPAVKSTLTRDLPPADPDTDYMDHSPTITAEGPLSPLSFYQDWQSSQLPLDSLDTDLYISSMRIPRKLGKKDRERERESSMNSDDANDTSPERRPYPHLLDMGIGHEWVTSPESVDTDLDDESVLSSSTSSLSPPYSDSDLRHFGDADEYLEDVDDDDLYLPHAFTPSESSSAIPSPVTDIYHPLDQYPSHFKHLYNPIISSTSPQPPPLTLNEPPPNEPPPLPPLIRRPSMPLEAVNGDPPLPCPFSRGSSSSMIGPLSADLQGTPSGSGWGRYEASAAQPHSHSSFGSVYEFDFDDDKSIPCSPSRRRSKELPSLDDDPFGLQDSGCGPFAESSYPASSSHAGGDVFQTGVTEHAEEPVQRVQWLSLPGAETDDDLIPKELASKNYVPDPTITVPSSKPLGSLLIWGPASARLNGSYSFPSSCTSDFLPMPARSPSPETLDLDLDPATLAELAPEGEGEDAQKLWEMRVKKARSENWEKERCRELEALLRLKLRLDEKRDEKRAESSGIGPSGSTDAGASGDVDAEVAQHHVESLQSAATNLRSVSLLCPSVSSSNTNSLPQQRSPPRKSPSSSSKTKITNMAQLVANMVFHRQQESSSSPKRSHATLRSSSSRSYGPVSSAQPSVTTVAAQHSNSVKAHATPRSPLRQVTLPDDFDQEDDEDEDDQCLSPLTPFGLCESPLSYLTELGPIGKEHDFS